MRKSQIWTVENKNINAERYLFARVFPLRVRNRINDKNNPIEMATIKNKLRTVTSGWNMVIKWFPLNFQSIMAIYLIGRPRSVFTASSKSFLDQEFPLNILNGYTKIISENQLMIPRRFFQYRGWCSICTWAPSIIWTPGLFDAHGIYIINCPSNISKPGSGLLSFNKLFIN